MLGTSDHVVDVISLGDVIGLKDVISHRDAISLGDVISRGGVTCEAIAAIGEATYLV